MARVLKPVGRLCVSVPMADNFIFKDAELLEGGYFRINKDYYGIRNETVHKAFKNENEVEEAFSPHFKDIQIGFCDDNYYGINVKVWIITAVRK